MLRFLTVVVLAVLSLTTVYAQKLTSASNPFSSLHFNNGPTDTITLAAIYDGNVGQLSTNIVDMLAVINKNNSARPIIFNYAVGFTLPGHDNKFYVPCKDEEFSKMLSKSPQKANARIQLTCVVYRF